MPKKTIVIFGISSFVGSNLAAFLSRHFRVIGTYYRNRVIVPDILTIKCDVLNRDAVQMILFTFRPDVTIYAVGLSSLEDCKNNEQVCEALNTSGVFNVTTFSERYKSKFVYLSSSFIFPGERKYYLEDDTPLPNTAFGKAKASAEFYVQKSCLNYLILRCCQLYGRSINPYQQTFFEYIQNKMLEDKSVQADYLIEIGFLDVMYLGMILKLCIDGDATNRLFHISSKDVTTHYSFSMEYSKIFNANSRNVSKKKWGFPAIESNMTTVDPDDGLQYLLDVDNIESYLNITLPSVAESLQYTRWRLGGKDRESKAPKATNDIEFI